MGKSIKKAAAVVAADVPKGKAGKKREAVDEIEKALSAKKTKAAPPAKAVPPSKEESSSSQEQEETSSEEEAGSESEEEAMEQTKEAAEPVEQESSDDGSDVSSESNEDAEPASAAKVAKEDSSSDDSDGEEDEEEDDNDDENEEEETPKKPQATGCKSKTLFMGNAPFSAELAEVQEFFKEAGEVIDVRFPLLETGRRKGFGYVEFATVEAAQEAMKFNGREFMSRTVKLDFAAERGTYTPQSGNDTVKGSNPSVFIRGFDNSLSEDKIRSSLEQHFAQCGEITRVSIPTDRESGVIKGIAYIDFKEQDSLSKALALKGSDLDGCELFVDQANPRGDNRGGFGGRSGGRFGGRSGGRFGGGSGGRRGGGRGGRGGRGFAN